MTKPTVSRLLSPLLAALLGSLAYASPGLGYCDPEPSIGWLDSGAYQFLASDGSQYNYYVYVPSTYDDCTGEYPLVLNFHGGGQNANYFKDIDFMTEFRAEAELEGAILVWIDSGFIPLWNNGMNLNAPYDHVLMVDEFVAFAETMLRIDPDRIHAVGFSNGAMFTQHVVTELPDVFSSVASIAGTSGGFIEFGSTCGDPYDPACGWEPLDTVWVSLPAAPSFVDMYLIRGALDTIVPVAGDGDIELLGIETYVLPALTNPSSPGDSDYELWADVTHCLIHTINVYAHSTKYRCTGLGAEVRQDVVDDMAHMPPTTGNSSFNGPRKVAKFLWNH